MADDAASGGPSAEGGTAGVGMAEDDTDEGAARAAEARDTLRAIAAGEVDAFVVSGGADDGTVVTLTSADRPYRMFVENMRDGAATLAPSGHIVFANRRLAEMVAFPIESIVGAPLAMLVASSSAAGLAQLVTPGPEGVAVVIDLVDGHGKTVPAMVGASPLDVDGHRLSCLTFADLSAQRTQDAVIAGLSSAQSARMVDLQAARDALSHQATHDALTGLPNRAMLVERIEWALAAPAARTGCTAVLFLDLDRFKLVNDTRGHAAGDAVLREAAARLVTMVRPQDTVCRLGGDEFVVLAPGVGSRDHAVDLATRLVAELARRPSPPSDVDRITVSVGVATSSDGATTAESLLHEADTAMYQAKALGGDRVELFDAALGRIVHERSLAQARLASAMAEDRLVVHYQPIVELETMALAGFEALVRMEEADRTLRQPSDFIPVAEESGLVVELGTRVLDLACREAAGWPDLGPAGSPGAIAVNLSARQFESGDLPFLVEAALRRTGLGAGRLHLEIVETALLELQPDVLVQLEQIRDLGVELGLDDFGTGYASLTHLHRLPLSFVKIDRSFVSGLGTEREDLRIVSAVVDLAANLGLRSIAEGVETQAQLERLRELGCDQAQGFLFSPALPSADLPDLLTRTTW